MKFGYLSILAALGFTFLFGCSKFESIESQRTLSSTELSFGNGSLKGADFVGTGANYSLQQSSGLFDFVQSNGRLSVSTSSTLQNIHSHYSDGEDLGNYIYSGSMMSTQSASGVGVTFLSDYPNSDSYYRLAKEEGASNFTLHARAGGACDGLDTGVVAQANIWYLYEIAIQADASSTKIRARIWPAQYRKPFNLQIDCSDAGTNRRIKGTVGLWASGAGVKNWADLLIAYDPYAPPVQQPPAPPQPPAPTPTPEVEIGIASASASSDDGNGPANVIDDNLLTRWSAAGDGQYIDLQFDARYDVSRVEVAYLSADQRTATFDVELLVNGSYVRVLTDQQSGSTNALTSYAVGNGQSATGLRLIGHGNSLNSWNSITEMKVYGVQVGSVPTPQPPAPTPVPPANCGSVLHGDSETRTRYQSLNVAYGSACISETQTRTCNDGSFTAWSPNNYQFDTCTVDPAPTPTPTPTPPPAGSIQVSSQAELNAALNSASGGEVIIMAAGNYGFIDFSNKQYASSVTLRSANFTNPAVINKFTMKNTKNVALEGIKLDYIYNSSDYAHSSRFVLDNANGITFRSCEFNGDTISGSGTAADGFGFAIGLYSVHSSNISVIDSEIHTFYRGVYFLFGSNISIVGTDVHTIRSDGMNFGAIQGITVEKNYVHDFRSPSGLGDHRDFIQILRNVGGSSDIIIRNNIFDTAAGDMSQILWAGGDGSSASHDRVLIENNMIYGAHINALSFPNTNDLTVRKNTLLYVQSPASHSVPRISVNGANLVVDRNIAVSGPAGTSNAYISENSYQSNFIMHATTLNGGYNEFSVKPGSFVESTGAGSDIMKLYPIGKGNTIKVLRGLP